MRSIILAPVAVLIIFAAYLHVDCASIGGGAETYLTSLGNIEGKSYFYDRTLNRTWVASKVYCTEFGMQLATITTQAQLNFLKSKHNPTGFTGFHWIGLRNAWSLSAVVWDTTSGQVNDFTGVGFSSHVGTMICGGYTSGTAPSFENWPCTRAAGVICQT